MIKRLVLVRRAAGVPAEQFGPRWRERTDEALAAMPGEARPSRLAHCVIRRRYGDDGYDGLAISWHHNEEAAGLHDRWTAQHLPADTVIDPEATTVLRVEERTAGGRRWLDERWRDPDGPTRLLLIGFIAPVDGLTREQFRDYWWDQHRPLADRLIPAELGPVAYVHNYVLPGEPGPWAGIGELYERSLDVAKQRAAWFDSAEAGPLVHDEGHFLVRNTRQVIITDHEIVISSPRY